MKSFVYVLVPFVLVLGACAGGSSGGGSSTSTTTSGMLSLPKATCGTGVCLSSNSGFGTRVISDGSADILASTAEEAYSYIQSTYVPAVNGKMADIEKLFESEGYNKCGGTSTDSKGEPQMDAIPDGTYALGTEYSVAVSSTSLLATPWAMEKKFILSKNSVAFLEVQLGCPSETERAIYLRLKDGTTMYEAYGHQDGSTKTIYAASEKPGTQTVNTNLYFKSTSVSVFEIAAVLKNFDAGDGPVSWSLSGGANLTASPALDLQLMITGGALSASGGTYHADAAGDITTNTRHCYTSIEPLAITSGNGVCPGLFTGPATVTLRGASRAMIDWDVAELGSDSIPTTF